MYTERAVKEGYAEYEAQLKALEKIIFSLIYNYKVELETDNKIAELEKEAREERDRLRRERESVLV